MLIVRKKGASEEQLRRIKQYLVDNDFDFHQSTGANRTIIGVIGDTGSVNREELAPEIIDIIADPQTSGGLLIAVAPQNLAATQQALAQGADQILAALQD